MTRGPCVANVSRVAGDMGATPGKRAVDQDSSATKESHAEFCHARIRTSRCCVRRRSSRGADLADPGRVGRCGAGRDQDRRAAVAGAAVAGRGVLRVGVVPVPRVGLPQGVGQTHRRAERPEDAVGQSLSRPAAPPRRGADARAVRGAGRPGRRAAHPRRAVRPLPHRRVRRVCVVQGARHRPQPVLAGQAPRLAGHHRVSGDQVDDGGRDRHPSAAGRGVRGTGHRRNRLRAKAVAAVAH